MAFRQAGQPVTDFKHFFHGKKLNFSNGGDDPLE
jgi:hypothetical protein